MTQKVKVAAAYYVQETDSVVWEVEMKDGKMAHLLWLKADFGPAFNISGDVPIPLINEFCAKMVGKEINLEISAE